MDLDRDDADGGEYPQNDAEEDCERCRRRLRGELLILCRAVNHTLCSNSCVEERSESRPRAKRSFITKTTKKKKIIGQRKQPIKFIGFVFSQFFFFFDRTGSSGNDSIGQFNEPHGTQIAYNIFFNN